MSALEKDNPISPAFKQAYAKRGTRVWDIHGNVHPVFLIPQAGVCPHRSCIMLAYSTMRDKKTPDKGDVFVMYAGGITEAENDRLEMFGEMRRWDVIARSQGMDSKAMMAKILDETKTFCGNSPQSDDITLMSIWMG